VLALCCAVTQPGAGQTRPSGSPVTRTVTIETRELTAPSLALMPDEQALVVGALGHLYRLPVAGGEATQLTFGPWYDTDPAVSPDGRRVAFASNRDGSSSNVFVLELASLAVTQLTREVDASRPAWSPDGRTLAFARTLAREDHPLSLMPGFADTALREVLTIPAAGGAATLLAPAANLETLFYLPDGRLGWSVRELVPGGGMFQAVRESRLEVRGADGRTTVLARAPGDIGRVAIARAGDAAYFASRGSLVRVPFGGDAAPLPVPRLVDGGTRVAVMRGGTVMYADGGHVWRWSDGGRAERIPVSASMAMEIRPREVPVWRAPAAGGGTVARLRPVQAPQLSPDGSRLATMAAGLLWEQPLQGRDPARRLVGGGAFMRDPVYSPDQRQLAFVASEGGRRELRVLDLGSNQMRTVFATGGASWPLHPAWSPDGRRIVFQQAQLLGAPFRLLVASLDDGRIEEVAQTVGSWVARPHFAADGRAIYFTNRPAKVAQLFRLDLGADAAARPVTALTRHVHEALVSPDGRWMAQRRNSEVWAAPLGTQPVADADLVRISEDGGRSFSFTPDSSAILYTAGGRVFRQALTGGARTEVPVRIEVDRPAPPPLLLTRLRVLDLDAGAFTDEQAVFVDNGRIQWIGSPDGRPLPAATVRVDAGGRYAMPGLFDLHVHSAWANQQANEDAFIAFGITSVRDTGGSIDLLTALDDRSDFTALPAPRYFYSGEILEGVMPHWGDAFLQIATEAEARAEVRRHAAAGADFVKVYPSLPWHLQQAMADEAHRLGMPIVGHGLAVDEITKRVIWGTSSLEHGGAVLNTYEDVHRLLAAAGTAADLTLSVGGGSLMRASDPGWIANPRVVEFVPEEARRAGQGGGGPNPLGRADQPREELLELFRPRFERLMRARDRGVAITGGTDSLMTGVFFGLSLHWEIAQLADAGVPPIDVLRTATAGGAALVGASADLGTLAPGRLADMLLLDANPLEDVRNTQRIWRVVKGGTMFDPVTLRGAGAPGAR